MPFHAGQNRPAWAAAGQGHGGKLRWRGDSAPAFSNIGAGARGTYEYLAEIRKLPDDIYKTASYLHHLANGLTRESGRGNAEVVCLLRPPCVQLFLQIQRAGDQSVHELLARVDAHLSRAAMGVR